MKKPERRVNQAIAHLPSIELGIRKLPLDSIRLEFQSREVCSEELIADIATAIMNGEEVAAVEVYHDGENYWLYDGFHRVYAALSLNRSEIKAEVVQGTYSDMNARWKEGLEAVKEANREWARKNGTVA